MKKIIILFIFVQFQSNWAQSLDQKIIGKWELIDFVSSNDEDGNEEKSSGMFWTFKNDKTCEERNDPDNPNNFTVYNYDITHYNCENGDYLPDFYYISMTKVADQTELCFLVSISIPDPTTNREILRLYAFGAMSPNILERK